MVTPGILALWEVILRYVLKNKFYFYCNPKQNHVSAKEILRKRKHFFQVVVAKLAVFCCTDGIIETTLVCLIFKE